MHILGCVFNVSTAAKMYYGICGVRFLSTDAMPTAVLASGTGVLLTGNSTIFPLCPIPFYPAVSWLAQKSTPSLHTWEETVWAMFRLNLQNNNVLLAMYSLQMYEGQQGSSVFGISTTFSPSLQSAGGHPLVSHGCRKWELQNQITFIWQSIYTRS